MFYCVAGVSDAPALPSAAVPKPSAFICLSKAFRSKTLQRTRPTQRHETERKTKL